MAPGLISELKHFPFPTPPSFPTFKVKKNNMKRCMWMREDYWHLPTSYSRPRTGQESCEPMNQEWLAPADDLRQSWHFFPSARILILKIKLQSELHSPWHNRYPHHTIHSVIQVRGHLPQLLTTVLLLPRSNLLPDAIHWTAASCLNKVKSQMQL